MAHWDWHEKGGEGERQGKYLYILLLPWSSWVFSNLFTPTLYRTSCSDLSLLEKSLKAIRPPTAWKQTPGLMWVNRRIPMNSMLHVAYFTAPHCTSLTEDTHCLVAQCDQALTQCWCQSLIKSWVFYEGKSNRTYCQRSSSVVWRCLCKKFLPRKLYSILDLWEKH